MRTCVILIFSLISICTSAQEYFSETLDSLYREDQIYFGVTYNTLFNTPKAFTQTNFSPGFSAGVIRDFPINKKRNLALGLGLGYALNIYAQNLKITKIENQGFVYDFVSSQNFSSNRFSHQALEIPFEFRWRTSNAINYKFWRLYLGVKASYIFGSKSYFKSENQTLSYNDLDFNKWQYGMTLSVGYNNWNAFIYYGLNSIFNNAYFNSVPIEARSLKIGLIFYIL